MSDRTPHRNVLPTVLTAVVLAALGLGGYLIVHDRAGAGGVSLAHTPKPSASPTTSIPPIPHWTVAKVTAPVVARRAPSIGAAMVARFSPRNGIGYPTLLLVRGIRTVGGLTWYDMWLPMRPNESHGWVHEGGLALYTTTTEIVIDLSRRVLGVHRAGKLVARYPVAIGEQGLETPTGFYYITEKLRPPTPDGVYGVLAMGLSAYQPKLPDWPLGGQVAIHGTNQPWLLGRAVSHGCIRMRNADVLAVSAAAPTGSPVLIKK
jgi:lipoprotein-anchoring transpeptidase ErfK/SrfK